MFVVKITYAELSAKCFLQFQKKAFVSGIMAYSLQFSIGPALCKSVFSAALQKYTEKKNTQGSTKKH